jgi:dTDP-4-dehydrorhamnose 3,5-epimerase
MRVETVKVPDAFVLTPSVFDDDRGSFLEWYRHDTLTSAIGHPFVIAQANCSVSRRGVVRGIHYADVPPGQAKYVTCVRGAVLDVIVDLRVGSPTFGTWDVVLLDDVERRAVYLAEGLGHAFCALSDESTVTYLCSTTYNPTAEHGISPVDGELGIGWQGLAASHGVDLGELVLSDKDRDAPTLAQARAAGALPTWQPTGPDRQQPAEKQPTGGEH